MTAHKNETKCPECDGWLCPFQKDERIAVVENEYEHLREVMAADLRRLQKETAAEIAFHEETIRQNRAVMKSLGELAEIGRLAVEWNGCPMNVAELGQRIRKHITAMDRATLAAHPADATQEPPK